MDQHILIVLMVKLDCLVAPLNMKELLRFVVIMLGGQYLLTGIITVLLKLFVIHWDLQHQVLQDFILLLFIILLLGVSSVRNAYYGEGSGPILM